MNVDGGTYPPGPVKETIGQLFGYAFMGAIALAVGLGNVVLPAEYAQWVEQNRGMVIGGGFMLNMIGNSLLQTGAYEVYLDDKLLFSKLQTGQVPNPNYVTELIRRQLTA